MALSILREIATCLRRPSYFSIMVDEYQYQSNREQLPICIRWLNEELEPQGVIGLYKIDDISDNTIMAVIKDTLIHLNLSISKCRGQC